MGFVSAVNMVELRSELLVGRCSGLDSRGLRRVDWVSCSEMSETDKMVNLLQTRLLHHPTDFSNSRAIVVCTSCSGACKGCKSPRRWVVGGRLEGGYETAIEKR